MDSVDLAQLILQYGVAGLALYFLFRLTNDKMEKIEKRLLEIKLLLEEIKDELRGNSRRETK